MAHEYINKLLKPIFKIRQRKIALNQTLTLKLGATLVLTVRPYQFDLLIHEYGDSIFRKKDL